MSKSPRIFYIDNLRILLISLVVLHHLAITYGAGGSWFYVEQNDSVIPVVFMNLFTATNQSFFMGMFFMISAFFLMKSLKKRTKMSLVVNKLKRLGIPLILYVVFISPVILYLLHNFAWNREITFTELYKSGHWISLGPMWFVAALLVFSLVTIGIDSGKKDVKETRIPGNRIIFGWALVIGIITYFVRIYFPVGWDLEPLGWQFAHFIQYIFLFYSGILAYRYNWFDQLSVRQMRPWIYIVLFSLIVLFPVVFISGGALDQGTDQFMGFGTWQSFAYAMWEQVVGFGIIIILLVVFKNRYNSQNALLMEASASAYTVYIIHALILVAVSLSFRNVNLHPNYKLLILAPLVLILCCMISSMIRRIPGLRNVL